VLFNEPKLLKSDQFVNVFYFRRTVSVLFNEPKLLKWYCANRRRKTTLRVSVLFNEPKLLKWRTRGDVQLLNVSFSALQRAEIAEMRFVGGIRRGTIRFQCSSTSRNC